jgi:hypothetical protein
LRFELDELFTKTLSGVDLDRTSRPCSLDIGKLRRPPTGRIFRDAFVRVFENNKALQNDGSKRIDLRLKYLGTLQEVAPATVNRDSRTYEIELHGADHTLHVLELFMLNSSPGKIHRFDLYRYGQVTGAKAKIVSCGKIGPT